jgi:hypothetical protein
VCKPSPAASDHALGAAARGEYTTDFLAPRVSPPPTSLPRVPVVLGFDPTTESAYAAYPWWPSP